MSVGPFVERPLRARLLLVDDEVELLDVLSEELGACGYAVARAKRGEEALRLAREQTFDVAVTDVKMLGMDGVELLRGAHGSDRARLPIVTA